jgi:MFS family permease
MSARQAGLISSAFNVGFLASLFAVGFLGDRFGQRRTYLLSSAAAAASALLFAAFARDFTTGLWLYALAGLCSGGSYTPGLAVLAQRYNAGQRGWAIGLYIAAGSAGYGFSLLLSSVAIPFAGWQGAFWATCLCPLLGMVLGAWMLRGQRDPDRVPSRTRSLFRATGALLRNRGALLIIAAYIFHTWELLAIWAWLPLFLAVAYGATAAGAGAAAAGAASIGAGFTGLSHLVSVAGPMIGGWLSDRVGRTAVIFLMSSLSALGALALGWLMGAPFWLVVVLALVIQVAGIGDSPVLSTGLTELVPAWELGGAFAWRSVLGFGAGAISPWLFGTVLDAIQGGANGAQPLAWGLAFATLGIGGLLCPLSALLLRNLPESRAMAGGKG